MYWNGVFRTAGGTQRSLRDTVASTDCAGKLCRATKECIGKAYSGRPAAHIGACGPPLRQLTVLESCARPQDSKCRRRARTHTHADAHTHKQTHTHKHTHKRTHKHTRAGRRGAGCVGPRSCPYKPYKPSYKPSYKLAYSVVQTVNSL